MLNDDYTPMGFAVELIQRFFGKDLDEATRIMRRITCVLRARQSVPVARRGHFG
jgi:hypothetical protein